MLDIADLILPEIHEFVTGSRAPFPTGRVLATILFVDLVGSTGRAVEIGDAAWRDLLQGFYRMATAELLRFEGREVDRAGDGLVATFDGPTRAFDVHVRCSGEPPTSVLVCAPASTRARSRRSTGRSAASR
jgi:class 3 adenylate cyclase